MRSTAAGEPGGVGWGARGRCQSAWALLIHSFGHAGSRQQIAETTVKRGVKERCFAGLHRKGSLDRNQALVDAARVPWCSRRLYPGGAWGTLAVQVLGRVGGRTPASNPRHPFPVLGSALASCTGRSLRSAQLRSDGVLSLTRRLLSVDASRRAGVEGVVPCHVDQRVMASSSPPQR